MKWNALPGPANFIDQVMQQLRDGINSIIAAPIFAPSNLEDTFNKQLAHDRWYVHRAQIDSSDDPLRWLTERLFLEPNQWVGWSVEKFSHELTPGSVVLIEGVTEKNWDAWRTFLREFELSSRQRASDERPVLLMFVRGVQTKRLLPAGAALVTSVWSGVFSELDILTYVDQRLRGSRSPPRHHKLMVRQIAALALWDIDLADYLVEQPERDVFDVQLVLKSAAIKFSRSGQLMQSGWENGGSEYFDGVELSHPFILIDLGDPSGELRRRVWSAQAAELLPLIEVRRRELVVNLRRFISCPFTIDGKGEIISLDELEIGTLSHLTRTRGIRGDLRHRAEWLASCRNTLAHLGLLVGEDALDARLHG